MSYKLIHVPVYIRKHALPFSVPNNKHSLKKKGKHTYLFAAALRFVSAVKKSWFKSLMYALLITYRALIKTI